MKIRADFVTNSSSSSFIIGKRTDETVTLDSVYQGMREKFKGAMDFGKKIRNIVLANPNLGSIVSSGRYWNISVIGEDDDYYNNMEKLRDLFIAQLGENAGDYIYSYFYNDLPEWVMKCTTYTKYVHAVKNNLYEAQSNSFQLLDYTKGSDCKWIYDKEAEEELENLTYEDKEVLSNVGSPILAWYYTDVKEAFRRTDEGKYKGLKPQKCFYECDYCTAYGTEAENKAYRANVRSDFEKLVQRIKSEKIPPEKACLYLMGRICIYSEDGNLPQYVVDALIKESVIYCAHMG